MAIVVFARSVIIFKIFTVEMSLTLTYYLYNESKSDVTMTIKSASGTSYLMTIVTNALSVTYLEIFPV